MFSTILVPLDGSDTAAAALPAAREMAQRFGARLLLLQVIDTTSASLALGANAAAGAITDPGAITGKVEARTATARAYLDATAELLGAEGVTATVEVRDGREGDSILEAAGDAGADLIVMTSHGRGGIGRLVFGSVTDHVVRHATTPVMVVRAAESGGGG